MYKSGGTLITLLVLLTLTSRLQAYPSSVIFAPTGESLGLGQFSAYAYVPINLRPSFGSSASWQGLDVGVAPEFSWTQGLRFGGIELGIDLIHGAYHRDRSSYIKPIFNAKLSVLAEAASWPAIGLGIMSFAPFQSSESVNLTYLSATKALHILNSDCGTLTLGIGYAVSASTFAFRGAPPLRDTRLAPLFGYASPDWHSLTLSLDSLGGVSESSSTNVAISYAINEQTDLMIGAFFTNDRALRNDEIYDGVFANLGATFEPFARRASQSE